MRGSDVVRLEPFDELGLAPRADLGADDRAAFDEQVGGDGSDVALGRSGGVLVDVTLGALRGARRTWRTKQANAYTSLLEPAPDTTLVVGHWAYQGSGYSPGGALLAAHVWHRRELERRFIAEGGCG